MSIVFSPYSPITTELFEKIKKIKLLISDVDGVLSDGKIYLTNSGDEIKNFNVRDGFGIVAIQKIGINFAVITGRSSNIVNTRMNSLGVELIYQGVQDKVPYLNKIIDKLNISKNEIAYIGDDVIDIPVFNCVGLSFCPKDAHPTVVAQATYTCHCKGGDGAVREVCDLILLAHNKIDLVGARKECLNSCFRYACQFVHTFFTIG